MIRFSAIFEVKLTVGKWFKSGIWNDQNTALGIAVEILLLSPRAKSKGDNKRLERKARSNAQKSYFTLVIF